jgi:hypothetical protein
MDSIAIFNKLNAIELPKTNYIVFNVNNTRGYFGKDEKGNVVFMLPSSSNKIIPVYQETKYLKFAFNKKCTFIINGDAETKIMHLLTCMEKERDKLLAFIRLTRAFSTNEFDNDQYYLAKLFSSISALFDKNRQVTELELQGLFAELYTIIYFKTLGCDISQYWQSKKKMKFDFSINNKKRIEIKSTTKINRIHHFKHDQLLSELYDIRIVSIMLQKNDHGISLGEVVNTIREYYSDNFALLLHIESIISNIDLELLFEYKYDKVYLKNNIKFFDASTIPHFNEKTPEGVFNAEYDCILDNVQGVPEDAIVKWIQEDSNV